MAGRDRPRPPKAVIVAVAIAVAVLSFLLGGTDDPGDTPQPGINAGEETVPLRGG